MRRDSIFYQLFTRSPSLLFNFVPNPPATAEDYKFESVAVKELKFEIDGVFLPPDTGEPGTVFFCEVQFQKDNALYERLFAELFLSLRLSGDRFSNWQAVVIYPSRSLEQDNTQKYQVLLSSEQVHRIYLDELGSVEDLPLPVALTVLTTLDAEPMKQGARTLVERTQRSTLPEAQQRFIMEMVVSILSYKFTELTRPEVEAMIGITLQQTRLYQDIKEEGRQEGLEEGRQEREQAREAARVELAEMLLSLLLQRLGKKMLPWSVGLMTLEFETLTGLGKELLNLESPREVLEWLILVQGGIRIRQGVPEQVLTGILGTLDKAAMQRLEALTVDEGLSLVDCLESGKSIAQLRKGVREWLAALVAEED